MTSTFTHTAVCPMRVAYLVQQVQERVSLGGEASYFMKCKHKKKQMGTIIVNLRKGCFYGGSPTGNVSLNEGFFTKHCNILQRTVL